MRQRRALAGTVLSVIVAAITALVVAGTAGARVAPVIDLSVALAATGDTITFTGESGVELADTCEIRLNDVEPDKPLCSADESGQFDGSFAVPLTQSPGTVNVLVCLPICDDIDTPAWTARATFDVGVQVPNVRKLPFEDAVDLLSKFGFEHSPQNPPADSDDVVQDQQPGPGTLRPEGDVVNLSFSSAPPASTPPEIVVQPTDPNTSPTTSIVTARHTPEPPDTDWLGIAVVVLALLTAGAYVIRTLVGRRGPRWVRTHVRIHVRSGEPSTRTETATRGDRDHSIEVAGAAQRASFSIRERPE